MNLNNFNIKKVYIKTKILLLIMAVFVFLVILFCVFFIQLKYFHVSNIYINKYRVGDKFFNKIIGPQKDISIYNINLKLLSNTIFNLYRASNIVIVKSYPNTIYINFTLPKVVVYIQLQGVKNIRLFGFNSKLEVVDIINKPSDIKFKKKHYPLILIDDFLSGREINTKDIKIIVKSLNISKLINILYFIKLNHSYIYSMIESIHVYNKSFNNNLFVRNNSIKFKIGNEDIFYNLFRLFLFKDSLLKYKINTVDLRFNKIIVR